MPGTAPSAAGAFADIDGSTRVAVVLSSGMSSLAEVDAAVTRVAAAGVPYAVLQCTSEYPCPPDPWPW